MNNQECINTIINLMNLRKLGFVSDGRDPTRLWYVECKICANFDDPWNRCKCALWRPRNIDGVCKYYKEEVEDNA